MKTQILLTIEHGDHITPENVARQVGDTLREHDIYPDVKVHTSAQLDVDAFIRVAVSKGEISGSHGYYLIVGGTIIIVKYSPRDFENMKIICGALRNEIRKVVEGNSYLLSPPKSV